MATNAKLTQLLANRSIESVRQRDADLDIDFTDGSTLSLTLKGSTGSITLTDSKEKEEYAE